MSREFLPHRPGCLGCETDAHSSQDKDLFMRRNTSMLGALLLLGQGLCSAQATGAMAAATQAMQSGRYEEAARLYQGLVQKDPGNAQVWMSLGMAQLRLGAADQAVEALSRTTDLKPDLANAHMFLGIAYSQENKLAAAAEALQQEIRLQPDSAEAQMWLGVVELKAGHPELATEPLDHAAALAPKDLSILEYRGQAHSDVAHDSYAAMARIDPDSWHVHKVQGHLYAMQNQHAEAIAELQKALKGAPNNSDLYDELGTEYRKNGDTQLALEAFRQELALSPGNPIAMYNLASLEIDREQPTEGVALLEKVIGSYAGAPSAYYYLGRGEDEQGHEAKAADALEQALKLHPDLQLQTQIQFELSRVYRKLGKTEESRAAIKELTRLKASMNANSGMLSGPADAPVTAKN